MVGRVEMPGGVLILRIVTATDMSTRETEAQVHPGITHFQTVLTSIGARRDLAYLVEVATLLCHMFLFSFLDAPGCSCLFSQGSQELLLMTPTSRSDFEMNSNGLLFRTDVQCSQHIESHLRRKRA